MTDYYLSSVDGSDVNSGLTDFSNAKATMAGVIALGLGAADRILTDEAHTETATGSIIHTFAGTEAAPVEVLSVQRSGNSPNGLSAAPSAIVGGDSDVHIRGNAYHYGMIYKGGVGGSGAGDVLKLSNTTALNECPYFDNCEFWCDSSNAGAEIRIGGTVGSSINGVRMYMRNPAFKFAHTSHNVDVDAVHLSIFDGDASILVSGSTVPSTLFEATTDVGVILECDGLDFTDITSGNDIVAGLGSDGPAILRFTNCKQANATLYTGAITHRNGPRLFFENVTNSDNNTTREWLSYEGTITHDTTHKRDNSDAPFGLKMVSTANTHISMPLCSEWIPFWIDTTGSKTFTGEFMHDSATDLDDDEFWMEVRFPGNTTDPKNSYDYSDKVADILTAGAAQENSTEGWGGSLTNENAQKCTVTATVNNPGYGYARYCLHKATYTVYADPDIGVA